MDMQDNTSHDSWGRGRVFSTCRRFRCCIIKPLWLTIASHFPPGLCEWVGGGGEQVACGLQRLQEWHPPFQQNCHWYLVWNHWEPFAMVSNQNSLQLMQYVAYIQAVNPFEHQGLPEPWFSEKQPFFIQSSEPVKSCMPCSHSDACLGPHGWKTHAYMGLCKWTT